MWVFCCAVFGSCLIGLMFLFSVGDKGWGTMALQFATYYWMVHGAHKLLEGGWRSSFGRDGASWILKDSLAMLIWPIMYRWIVRRSETE